MKKLMFGILLLTGCTGSYRAGDCARVKYGFYQNMVGRVIEVNPTTVYVDLYVHSQWRTIGFNAAAVKQTTCGKDD